MIDVKLETVRRDIHAFTLGLLWLLALTAGLMSGDDVRKAAVWLDTLAQQTSHLAVPAFAVGFLLAVTGVVLPYCLFHVFEPFTLAIMTMAGKLLDLMLPWDPALDTAALSAVRSNLGVDASTARDRCEVFVEAYLPRLAAALALEHQINAFRWKALLPGAIFVAALAARLFAAHLGTPWPVVLGTTIGFVMFGCGAWLAHRQVREESRSYSLAVLVAAKDSTKAPQ